MLSTATKIQIPHASSFILSQIPPSMAMADDPAELCRLLETGNEEERIIALKSALHLFSSGKLPQAGPLLITIIRFVLPNQKNKFLKKLVLLFFELVPKTDAQGQLLSEMILLCNALRNDLQHPNEWVRGVTLRFLTRIREAELLEPLVPTVRQCLEHRHPYVRRNAVFALLCIYQYHDFLIPDAPEILFNLLSTENDFPCRRNLFLALATVDSQAAWQWCCDQVEGDVSKLLSLDGALQLAIIEFIWQRQVDNVKEGLDTALVIIATLLHPFPSTAIPSSSSSSSSSPSSSSIVRFAAASAALRLPNPPTTLTRTVATTYLDLASGASIDHNARLLALDRFRELLTRHPSVVAEEVGSGLVRVLAAGSSAGDLTLRRRALELLGEGVTARQAVEVVNLLIKELPSSNNVGSRSSFDDATSIEYQQALLATIHRIALRFPGQVAPLVVRCYADLLLQGKQIASPVLLDALKYCKYSLDRNAVILSNETITRLMELGQKGAINLAILDTEVIVSWLWIIGEFTPSELINSIVATLASWMGSLPPTFETEIPNNPADTTNSIPLDSNLGGPPRLNPDGTYASETALEARPNRRSPTLSSQDEAYPLKAVIKGKEGWRVAVTLAHSLCKLALRTLPTSSSSLPSSYSSNSSSTVVTPTILRSMLIISGAIKLCLYYLSSTGSSTLEDLSTASTCYFRQQHIDQDAFEQMLFYLKVLSQPKETKLIEAFRVDCRRALDQLVAREVSGGKANLPGIGGQNQRIAPDEPILWATSIVGLDKGKVDGDQINRSKIELPKALLGSDLASSGSATMTLRHPISMLARVVQLTGFSDEIYAECYLTISHSDILLDVLLVNQTDRVLQNVALEVASSTPQDLRVTEKAPVINIAAQGFAVVKASLKVRSTTSSLIFGCLSYGVTDLRSIMLNAVPIDVSEYIKAVPMDEDRFRTLWPTLEWENKIIVPLIPNAQIDGISSSGRNPLRIIMERLVEEGHLACLTTDWGINDTGDYLAANLHAISCFGEEVLANICLERGTGDELDKVDYNGEDKAGEEGVSGHLRLRSKTQGIAVALGDRISDTIAKMRNRSAC